MAAQAETAVKPSYNCYKVPGLQNPILSTPNISYLEDRYVLGGQLGLGQFGVIRSCIDLLTGEALASKSIAKDRLISPDDVRRVKLEIEVMARLSGHPNVVDLKAVYEDHNSVHLIMELCAGGELFDRLKKQGRFSEWEASVLFRHLMEIVAHCHSKGIVHCDLKPENILLVSKSSLSQIKLADFGLATYIKPGQWLTGTVGSPFYIAPEVLAGGYNEEADVWSAGVILYILLSGVPPFWGKTKSKIFENIRSAELRFPSDCWCSISDSAKELVAGMLQRDPAQRLTANQVLGHSWVKEYGYGNGTSLPACINFHSNQLPATVSCSRDVSFSAEPVDLHENQSDCVPSTLPRGFSFSPLIAADDLPCTNVAVSFCMPYDEPIVLKSSFPITSLPSFSFLGSTETAEVHNTLEFRCEASDEPPLDGPLASVSGDNDILITVKVSRVDALRVNGSPVIGIDSRRNKTISLGETEHIDIMVTESVIRWASCTNLTSTHSLRSSLVC